MQSDLYKFFSNKKILILGFGKEGQSTLEILSKIPCIISIADKNQNAIPEDWQGEALIGEDYLCFENFNKYDIIMKSPGIPLLGEIPLEIKEKITSQTDLLLRFRKNPIIGVTGTKGKSTTSSLIFHILNSCGKKAELIGNIGVPPLKHQFSPETIIVCEMSCHQLEYVKASPDVAVLLNIYEEHLDHYNNFDDYRSAKENIYLYQKSEDLLIYNDELFCEKLLSSKSEKLSLSYGNSGDIYVDDNFVFIKNEKIPIHEIKTHLPGRHNLYNIAAALTAALNLGCDLKAAVKSIAEFKGLPHRLELAGKINGVEYINDSISTIPRAAIAAINAFPDSDTIIIGGMDRGISYAELIDFLPKCGIINLIALPDSGLKIAGALENTQLCIYCAKDLPDAVDYASRVTKRRCILSPAAASYGFYRNFEHRGDHFKELLNQIRRI